MKLNRLILQHFKNNAETNIFPSQRINIFVGENGAGKTNILDAIYYLSFCKSPYHSGDNKNILDGENYFMIRGEYITYKGSIDKVHISYIKGERKKIKRNDKEYDRISDHIGEFPLVIISPYDSTLILGGSEERRKYIDSVISQFDNAYLQTLLNYNKTLQQRNALLKSLAENPSLDNSILDVYNEKLAALGTQIHIKRKTFLENFIPIIQNYYKFISNEKEISNIRYRSQLNDNDFIQLLKSNYRKDSILKYTGVGIHRDDIDFELNSFPIKNYGSQGQQKTFLLALKIAQFEYIYKKKTYKPLLLLDDVFDKLDRKRVQQLMKLVSKNEFGQIFITDTNRERIENIFADIEVEKKIFLVENGTVAEIK